MITFYRIERADGKSLYVGNTRFLKKYDMYYHNDSSHHVGIEDSILDIFYSRVAYTYAKLGMFDAYRNHQSVYDHIRLILSLKRFRCFFNSLDDIRNWFRDDHIEALSNNNYILYKYDFVVDFNSNKIYICDIQSAIDIEYMKRPNTIKTIVDWSVI